MKTEQEIIKDRLRETCGGSCIDDSKNCHCFGMLSEEFLKEIGTTPDEYEPIYSYDECSFYDKICNEVKNEYIEKLNYKKKFIDGLCDAVNLNVPVVNDITLESFKEKLMDVDSEQIASHVFMASMFGRPKDNTSLEDRDEYVYFLHSDNGVKIGRSYCPHKRSRTIGTKVPFEIKMTEIYRVDNMKNAENGLHRHFKDNRLNGEWFDLDESAIDEARGIVLNKYNGVLS